MGVSVWLFEKLLGISRTGCSKFVKKLLKKSWMLLSFSKNNNNNNNRLKKLETAFSMSE